MARPMAATERNDVYRPDRWVADSTLSARYPIYTRANVGEVFPDPVSYTHLTLPTICSV